MALISLNSNLSSLKAIGKLGEATLELSGTFERLSSGLRINRAADDAAGLAVALTLNSNGRVLTQGVRNINDGISYLNVAEGASHELKSILLRMRELATQSSSGAYSDTQREALDSENAAMQQEYNRILETSVFNGRKIFDGSASALTLQAGFGRDGTLTADLAVNTVSNGTFAPRQDFSAAGAYYVASADISGDGKIDLVHTGGGVSVLLGNGDGTFGASQVVASVPFPHGVALSDLNGDGRLDLATADFGGGSGTTVSVALGNGDGTFQAANAFTAGLQPNSITAADFNGDGSIDLMTADITGGTLSVLLGNGDGTFGSRLSFGVGAGPRIATSADLNGDGKLDLLSADSLAGSLSVLLGNGDGTFNARQSFTTAPSPFSVLAADFNGDGKLDLGTADYSGITASVLLGNGDGTFGTARSFGVEGSPHSIKTGDFNDDGKLDLVTADWGTGGGNTLSVLMGNGDGTFQARSTLSTPIDPHSVDVADFNGDGTLDLAAATYAGGSISILLGNQSRTSLAPIGDISIATRAGALTAQGQIDTLLEDVSKVSGAIGASMSRFEVAVRTTSAMADAYKAAESRIMDADIAFESANLMRNQILQQAATSILAQANQLPALALRLLAS